MQLPDDCWTSEEIVKVSIRWRNKRRKVKDVLTSGADAIRFWNRFHAHLQCRMYNLLEITPPGRSTEYYTLETGDKVMLTDVLTIWVEDGKSREFVFQRYGSESLAVPCIPELPRKNLF